MFGLGSDSRFTGGESSGNVSFGAAYDPEDPWTDGIDATTGTYIGERIPHRDPKLSRMSKPPTWTGWDFSPDGLLDSVDDGTLVVEVDGVTHTVQLDADLTSPTSAVSLLNERLAGVATVSLNPNEQFVISSVTTGRSSSVHIDASSSSKKARFMLSAPAGTLLELNHRLQSMSSDPLEMFSDPQKAIVYSRERRTGLLIAESVGEGVADMATETRKCASEAETDLIRSASLLLDSLGDREYVQLS